MSRRWMLKRGFQKRAPWISKFMIDGEPWGGGFDPESDIRIVWFREHFPEVETVLDLGCLEGAQSLLFSKIPSVKKVVGLEARARNLDKANYIKNITRNEKVHFYQADVESADLAPFGTFDVVFCAGILYHLANPWNLVRRMSEVSHRAFIWTHYAKPDQPKIVRNGYRGMVYHELGFADPQSGMSHESFWLEFDELIRMIEENGFPRVTVIENNPTPSIGPVTTLIAER